MKDFLKILIRLLDILKMGWLNLKIHSLNIEINIENIEINIE